MAAADQHDDLPIGVDTWGEKKHGVYAPGTTFTFEDGSKVKLDELPDYIGGAAKSRPAAKRVVPRAPSRDGS